MRNLKRALSLALAMVMLLGMMMINTNAVSNFADADEIVNQEAVAITAGMGLFAGSDGKFNPKGNVTRAQMATIIVKMLRGADFNADAFKGAANPFTDTAAFEGGWAEGYINACFQMGVVKGYGDGTFKPGNSVTTAEAVTMIINALKVDAGQGEWPLTVMAKASAMKLFGDLNPAPATNEALIRDQLAVITLEGLQYSDSGKSGYTVEGVAFVFDNMTDALKAAGYDATKITEVVGDDTLAGEVYNLSVATGFITENEATGADYTVVADETFDIETGLDMVGHYVSVYYKAPAQGEYVEAYETYAVVEESTAVVVTEDIGSAKEYKTAFGRDYDLSAEIIYFDGQYAEVDSMGGEVSYIAGSSAPKGTYIIYENKVVAFLQPGTAIASRLLDITDFDGEKTYTLDGVDNPIDEANITIYGGAKKDDYVTYTMAGGQYVLSPVDPVKGTATKYSTNADGDIVITVGGAAYPLFAAENNQAGLEADPARLTLSTEQYTFYVTQDGQIIGWTGADGAGASDVNVDDIVYALGYFALESKDGNYGAKVKKYFLQGVNTDGEEAHVLLAIEYDTNKDNVFGGEGDEATLGTVPAEPAMREGFYITSNPENKDAKKEGVKDVIRIGVKDERSEATGNLFYGLNRWGSSGENAIVWPASYANNHVCTTACAAETTHNNTIVSGASNHSGSGDENAGNKATRTFFSSDLKYVMIDGVLGEPLKTSVGGSDFQWTLPTSEEMKHPMLYKLNEAGATEIVMIAIRKDPNDLSASTTTIFVGDTTPVATSADGDLYTVYTAADGVKMEVVLHGVDGESAPALGFWSYKVEEDGSWTQLNKLNDSKVLGYTGDLQELYLAGLFGGSTLSVNFANGSSVPYITGADASAAKVVDLRSESEKSASGLATITSVEQLGNLAESGKLVSVYVYNKSNTTASCIYVKSVVNNPNGVVFVTDPATGAAVTLEGKAKTVAVSSGALSTGFGRVKNAQGAIILEQVTGAKYRTNELIVSVDGSTINTQTIADGIAKSLKVTDKTALVDTTTLGIGSMDELEAALEAGKMLTVAIAGEDGANATLVVITGQGDPYLTNGDEVYFSATPVAGSVTGEMLTGVKEGEQYTFTVTEVVYPEGIAAARAAGAGYYTISKDGEGDVTLTFKANFIPKSGDAFYVQGRLNAVGGLYYAVVVSNENDLTAGTWGYMLAESVSASYVARLTSAGTSTHYFWMADSNDDLVCFKGLWQSETDVAARKFSYHEKISSLTDTALGLQNSHTSGCLSSPWGHSDNCYVSGATRYYETCGTLTVNSSTVVVDITGNGVTTLAAAKALTDAGEALINVFSADGTRTSGTATCVIVIPMNPADAVLP